MKGETSRLNEHHPICAVVPSGIATACCSSIFHDLIIPDRHVLADMVDPNSLKSRYATPIVQIVNIRALMQQYACRSSIANRSAAMIVGYVRAFGLGATHNEILCAVIDEHWPAPVGFCDVAGKT